jgi:BlaI family penicillinase repressor
MCTADGRMLDLARKNAIKLTRFEMEIMEVLWGLGKASVREILEQIPDRKRPAYTTVQTIVKRLEEKGAVRRYRKISNAYIFEPAITRGALGSRLIAELLELFGGSARPLMAQMAESGQVSLEDLKEAERILAGKPKPSKPE